MENIGQQFLTFFEKLLNIFIVEGVSVDTQQLVKIVILLMILLILATLASIAIAIIAKVLSPAVRGMSKPEYTFGSLLAILIFTFTEPTFGGSCWLIFGIVCAWITYRYIMDKKSQKVAEEDRRNWD